jgi:hypothetical protein
MQGCTLTILTRKPDWKGSPEAFAFAESLTLGLRF